MNTERIDDLLARREAGDEMAGYQAFLLMSKAWPDLVEQNTKMRAELVEAMAARTMSGEGTMNARSEMKARLKQMPSSLNDAICTIDLASKHIETLENAIRRAIYSNSHNHTQIECAMEDLKNALLDGQP